MALIDDLADQLAIDTLAAMDRFGNDRLYLDVGKMIGTSSPTMQEAYLTSMRMRLAILRGRKFLEQTIRAAETGADAPKAPRDTDPGGH
ncbi:MAG: hypothetical protein ACRCSU_08385 [Paracoccaceae bacterium]